MMKFIYLGLLLATHTSLAVDVELTYSPCAETMGIKAEHVDAVKLLTQLSDQMGFVLISSPKVTHTVSIKGLHTPKALLQKILQGQNHFISSHPSQQCGGRSQVSEVVLLAPGESTQSSNLVKHLPRGNSSTKNYQHIADMPNYVQQVQTKQREAKKANMTPEQRAEFMYLKGRFKKGMHNEER